MRVPAVINGSSRCFDQVIDRFFIHIVGAGIPNILIRGYKTGSVKGIQYYNLAVFYLNHITRFYNSASFFRNCDSRKHHFAGVKGKRWNTNPYFQ